MMDFLASPGRLITFEGVEGSGKSTLIDRLDRGLRASGVHARLVREPGATALGEAIRERVLDPAQGPVDGWAELFLMLAARAQLVRELIEPALAAGDVILCDRYMDASVAYQGAGRGNRGTWRRDDIAVDEQLLAGVDACGPGAHSVGRAQLAQ